MLVKGADWAADQIVGRDVVEARGGQVVRIGVEQGHSTSAIVDRVRALKGGSGREPARPVLTRSPDSPITLGRRVSVLLLHW